MKRDSHPSPLFTRRRLLPPLLAAALLPGGSAFAAETQSIVNVSYDVTREYYQEYNKLFTAHWKKKTGADVRVEQSHAGSSKQARAVLDGLEADVVTMNQSTDIDLLANGGLVAKNWRDKFPYQASPWTSTVLFLVRKGNPKKIRDWNDLVKPGVKVIIPNPKTSGNGRYSYVAAWAYGVKNGGGKEAAGRGFVTKLFKNVPVLDTGGRGATTTFVQRGIGDVLLTFENEVRQAIQAFGEDKFEVVVPSLSVEADAPVAVVDKVVDKRGTRPIAEEYLRFLYGEAAQELAAKQWLRPRLESVLQKHSKRFPAIQRVTVDETLGGWDKALKTHFNEGGVFDQIYKPSKR